VEKLRALGAHISRVTIPTPEFDFGLT
jgi:hypothetical protein